MGIVMKEVMTIVARVQRLVIGVLLMLGGVCSHFSTA